MSATTEFDFLGIPVLVTGGGGFIGSHLVDALQRYGARVRVLDDFSTGHRRNLDEAVPDAEVVAGDIRALETCRQCCEGVEYVFHQAALGSVPRSVQDPATSLAVNVQGTANMLAAANEQGVRRFIYASSSSVYGDSELLPKVEGSEGRPLSPYACSKKVCEDIASVFDRCYELETVGLRYFNIYGPRQDPDGPYAAVIPRFFKAALLGEEPLIYGDGMQSRDFTYVGDAVRANLLAAVAETEASGRAFNVAAGERTTVLELARLIGESVGTSVEPRHGPQRPGDVKHSLADLTAIGELLGFRSETSLRDGLETCVEYYSGLFVPIP